MSQIVTVPNAVLRQPTKPVEVLNARVLSILKDMEKTLKAAKKPQGVGLAAPQIGVSLRIFLIRPTPKGSITVFINPEIIKYSQRKIKPNSKDGVYEGCLSIPHHYAPLERSTSVTVRYQTLTANPKSEIRNSKQIQKFKTLENSNLDIVSDLEFRASSLIQKTETFSGFAAHVIQHEMDHLNGILFIDRVLEQNAPLFKFEGKTWHEVTI